MTNWPPVGSSNLTLPITNQYLTIMEIRRRDLYSPVLDTAFKIAEDYFKQLETV